MCACMCVVVTERGLVMRSTTELIPFPYLRQVFNKASPVSESNLTAEDYSPKSALLLWSCSSYYTQSCNNKIYLI